MGEAVYAGVDNKYMEIREVLGADKVKDAMKLEAHLRNKLDYFVTEDNDFLKKREILKNKFGVNIVTPQELESVCSIKVV